MLRARHLDPLTPAATVHAANLCGMPGDAGLQAAIHRSRSPACVQLTHE